MEILLGGINDESRFACESRLVKIYQIENGPSHEEDSKYPLINYANRCQPEV